MLRQLVMGVRGVIDKMIRGYIMASYLLEPSFSSIAIPAKRGLSWVKYFTLAQILSRR